MASSTKNNGASLIHGLFSQGARISIGNHHQGGVGPGGGPGGGDVNGVTDQLLRERERCEELVQRLNKVNKELGETPGAYRAGYRPRVWTRGLSTSAIQHRITTGG